MNGKPWRQYRNYVLKTVYALLTLQVVACANIEQVTPLDSSIANPTISPNTVFPDKLPKGMSRFEDSPFVFVHADHASTFAASLLVPIPFVTDAVVNSANRRRDEQRNSHYLTIDANSLLSEKIKDHQYFKPTGGDYSLHILIPIEECIDDVYRMSVLFQLEKDDWMGRYYYHLPNPLPSSDISNPTDQELAVFERELSEGMDKLITIIGNELNGEYNNPGMPVTIGSLYILGGSIGGLVNPEVFKVDALQVASTPEDVIVRVPGAPTAAANGGGMAFGLHYFKRNQLHTYDMKN